MLCCCEKLSASIRKRPLNIILIFGVGALYLINNSYLKVHTTGVLQAFFIGYFNDLICPLFLLSYSNLLLLAVDRELTHLWAICVITVISGCIWEFAAPLVKKTSVTDPMDIVCYIIGAIAYWVILSFSRGKFK